MNVERLLGLGFFLVGLFFLLNSKISLTGAVIGSSAVSSAFSLIFGVGFVIVGVGVMAKGKGLELIIEIPLPRLARVNYAINDPVLKRMTEDALKNHQILKTSNRKISYLIETGEMGSIGKTFKYIDDTSNKYFYLRDVSSGARIFLKKLSDNEYDLVGICEGTQKKEEETKMINKIREIYKLELKKKKK